MFWNGYSSHGIKPSFLSSASRGKYYFFTGLLYYAEHYYWNYGNAFLLLSTVILFVIDLKMRYYWAEQHVQIYKNKERTCKVK